MKYDKELYLDSGIYGGEEDIQAHTEKIVKCRKAHTCAACSKEIQRGEEALLERGFYSDGPISVYTCVPCIEEWLEETGQVQMEEEEEP